MSDGCITKKIQLQKGYSLIELMRDYGTGADKHHSVRSSGDSGHEVVEWM
jgi:hypothetical protein